MPEGNLISLILSVLAGAGFDKIAGGMGKLAQSGQNIQQLFSLPNFPLLLAGAGLRDTANSMEIMGPLLKSFAPPQQSQQSEQPAPEQLSAAMQMLSARLSPGLGGIRPPVGGGPMGQPMNRPPALGLP